MDRLDEPAVILQAGQFPPGEELGARADLEDAGSAPVRRIGFEELEEALRDGQGSVVLLSGSEQGLEALVSAKSLAPGLPVVMIFDAGQIELLREALEHGLDSYVVRTESWEATWSIVAVLLKRWIGVDARRERDRAPVHTMSPPEARVELHDESFWAFFEAAPLGIKILDQKNCILHANRKLQQMLGYTEAELRQLTEQDLIQEEDRDAGWESFSSLVRGETDFSTVAVNHLHKSGENVPTSLGRVALRDGEELKYVFEVGVTLTETRAEQGEALSSQPTEKPKFVDELVGGIAHDLRNILTLISLDTEMMRSRDGDEDAARDESTRTLERIIQAAQRGHRIADRIHRLGRPQGEAVEVDVREYLNDFSDLLEAMLPDEAELRVETGDEPMVITAEAGQLDQVVMNLVRNAADAIDDDGEVVVEAQVSQVDQQIAHAKPPVEPGEYVQICVVDTGHGIDEETKAHIFEPYFSTRGGASERGLGLANVERAVHELGGSIAVDSQVGEGSTFRVFLPLGPPSEG